MAVLTCKEYKIIIRKWKKGVPKAEIARGLGCSTITVTRTIARYEKTGSPHPPVWGRTNCRKGKKMCQFI